jgi:hypothetical protein
MATNSVNKLIKEYFADMAGVSTSGLSLNDAMRKGLEAAGYSGALTVMLKDWAIDRAGDGTSINAALRLALVDMGGSGSSINTLIGEVFDNTVTWANQSAKWEDETRVWDYIN